MSLYKFNGTKGITLSISPFGITIENWLITHTKQKGKHP
jgi:hypothetical protein